MDFDSGSYVYSGGESASTVRSMNDLDTLDDFLAALEMYAEIEPSRAVNTLVKQVKERIERIVKDSIL